MESRVYLYMGEWSKSYEASERILAVSYTHLDVYKRQIMWWHNVLSMVREWITVQTGTVCPEARNVQLLSLIHI